MMINLGAVTGVLPIAGVPLPFVSYGGSSLLPSLTAVGMLMSFARRRPEPVLLTGDDPAAGTPAEALAGRRGD
jgi:cell division protein FtsW